MVASERAAFSAQESWEAIRDRAASSDRPRPRRRRSCSFSEQTTQSVADQGKAASKDASNKSGTRTARKRVEGGWLWTERGVLWSGESRPSQERTQARTRGWTMELRRARAEGLAKTRGASRRRSTPPSSLRTEGPNALAIGATAAPPGAWSAWVTSSVSRTSPPNSGNMRATVDFPQAMPPVTARNGRDMVGYAKKGEGGNAWGEARLVATCPRSPSWSPRRPPKRRRRPRYGGCGRRDRPCGR